MIYAIIFKSSAQADNCFHHRANFALTNELSTYTRISPGRRVESLMNFRRRLQDNEAV